MTFRRTLWLGPILVTALCACGPRIDLSQDASTPFRPPADGGGLASDAGLDAGVLDDAGGLDAGLDAGPPDAAIIGVRQEGEVCLEDDPCAPGLFCIPELNDPTLTICRRSCALIEDNVVTEVPELCDEFDSCQTILDETTTQWVATACVPIQYVRDGLCYAIEDPDACALDRVCAATEVISGPDGTPLVQEMRCRDVCALGDAEDESCLFGDVCIFDWITQAVSDYQLVDPNNPDSRVSCTASLCPTSDAPGCPCDGAEGYRCTPVQGEEYCIHPRGLCGSPAPYVGVGDLPLSVDQLCNEVVDHDFCDREPYNQLDDGALPFCLDIQGPREDDGICIAFCSQYAYDYDGDGSIDFAGGEGPLNLACLDGYDCDRAFSREIGLYNPGPVEVPCDPALCPEDEPCGDCNGAECVTSDFFVTTPSACAAVFGTCQPIPGPDAGPDAGTDGGLDAGGVDGGDAGTLDGGAGGDAGLDAGAGDASSSDASVFDASVFDAGDAG